jgi:hypothetical protein
MESAKSRDLRPILAFLGKLGQTQDWVAGAGGFEPPYDHLPASRCNQQQSCSELTGLRALKERCCVELERLRRLRDLALPGVYPGRG